MAVIKSINKKYEVWCKTGGKCWYCGKQTKIINQENMKTIDGNTWFTVDHVIPQIAGGTDDIDNLLPCCMGCNRAKKDSTTEEYRELMSRKAAGVPRFSDEQVDYLRLHGIELPKLTPYTFWGEMNHESVA